MIVKMKKLTLICTAKEQDRTLEALRDLKAVHIEHLESPSGLEIDEAKQVLQQVKKVHENLAEPNHEVRPATEPSDTLIDDIHALLKERDELHEQQSSLLTEQNQLSPYGDFNPKSLEQLNQQGVYAKLIQFGLKEDISWPENICIKEISRDKSSIYALALSRHEVELPCYEMALPAKSMRDIEEQLQAIKAKLIEIEAEIKALSNHRSTVQERLNHAHDDLVYQEVKTGMAATDNLVYLAGYIPVDQLESLKSKAASHGWGYDLREINDEDQPPTLLRNPKWVDPIKAVLQVIGVVPGYKELDVSMVFLLFLNIFFAILIGDAGYGLLFIALTFLAQRKNKKAPSYVFNLLYMMSSCTVVWGVLTGTYFGINFDALPVSLQQVSNEWLRGYGDDALAMNNIMFFCFVLGTIHLVIGHVWNVIRKINSWAALSDIGWIGSTLTMFYAVRMMVLGESFPPIMLYSLVGGLVLIVISLVMEKAYFGLVTLALDVISNFVDIISYVRLYAVGAASFAIANAFNEMAISSLGSNGPWIGGLIAALTLFGGHTLNILLCAMGILVHGIRLNTLEFSSHAGVQWGGLHYKPFKRTEEHI